MHEDHKYDFLLSPSSTHELYDRHVHDSPEEIATVRSALREDSRAIVRVNAIVALSASLKERAIPDLMAALDDTDPDVVSEAAFSLAASAPEYLSRPENKETMAALRSHAAAVRAALSSANVRVRFNAATVLVALVDPDVDLGILLRDTTSLVRAEGLKLAAARATAGHAIGPADVKLLDAVARTDADPQLRTRAVNLVADHAPMLAAPVLVAAFERGDVDRGLAQTIEANKLGYLVPAIVAYVQKQPKEAYWLKTLVVLKATCASQVIAGLLADYTTGELAAEALRSLSGHSDWTAAQLEGWAKQQPADVAPCK